jgi:hypothetical protein
VTDEMMRPHNAAIHQQSRCRYEMELKEPKNHKDAGILNDLIDGRGGKNERAVGSDVQ